MVYFLLALNVLIMSAGQLLFKQSATFINNHADLSFLMRYLVNPWFYEAIFLYVISTFIWTQVLTQVKLGIAYPIMSLSYVLVFFGAYLFFHEKISTTGIGGIVFIVAGISLIAMQ